MNKNSFKRYLKDIAEEVTSADIATVDNKLNLIKRPKRLQKGKKCKLHKRLNCKRCQDAIEDNY
jgi:hypothetical protein